MMERIRRMIDVVVFLLVCILQENKGCRSPLFEVFANQYRKNLKNILRIISESALRAPIWRGRVLLLTSIGIVLLFPPQVVHAVSLRKDRRGAVYITICNSGNTTLDVARVTNAGFYGYTNKQVRWIAEGWRQVEPGDCERFERSLGKPSGHLYLPGYYYFAFIITGKNGQGTIKGKLDPGPSAFKNTNRRFCVKTAQRFKRVGLRSFLDNCPSGWVSVPFSIGIDAAWAGGSYELTINADRSSEVELLTPPKP